jgi:hypothetical protein
MRQHSSRNAAVLDFFSPLNRNKHGVRVRRGETLEKFASAETCALDFHAIRWLSLLRDIALGHPHRRNHVFSARVKLGHAKIEKQK